MAPVSLAQLPVTGNAVTRTPYAQRMWAWTFIAASILAAIVSSACDSWVNYTVVNRSQQDLLTWAVSKRCHEPATTRQDFTETARVPAGETYQYDGRTGKTPRCVQVATIDRRLVVEEPHIYGMTVAVEDPVRPFGEPIPQPEDLASKSLASNFREASPADKLVFITAAILCLSLVAGAGILAFRLLRGLARRHLPWAG
jgi:hypothetical protein